MLDDVQMRGVLYEDDTDLFQDIMPRWWNLLTCAKSWREIYHGSTILNQELDISVNERCMVGEVMLYTDEYAYPRIHDHSEEQYAKDKILEQYGLLFFNLITAMVDTQLMMDDFERGSDDHIRAQLVLDNESLSFIRTLRIFCDHLRAHHSDDIANARAYHKSASLRIAQASESNPNTVVTK